MGSSGAGSPRHDLPPALIEMPFPTRLAAVPSFEFDHQVQQAVVF
jgi:hypothetical protein